MHPLYYHREAIMKSHVLCHLLITLECNSEVWRPGSEHICITFPFTAVFSLTPLILLRYNQALLGVQTENSTVAKEKCRGLRWCGWQCENEIRSRKASLSDTSVTFKRIGFDFPSVNGGCNNSFCSYIAVNQSPLSATTLLEMGDKIHSPFLVKINVF